MQNFLVWSAITSTLLVFALAGYGGVVGAIG
jgi:hypothetical protein